MSEGGIHVRSIAGQAHWQQGKVERHQQTLKEHLARTIAHSGVDKIQEVKIVLNECCHAKNPMLREFSFCMPQ